MTTELVTKGIVYPKCQLINIDVGAMAYAEDQVSSVPTKGIIITRCYLVTKEEIAAAVWDEPTKDHQTNGTFGKAVYDIFIRSIKSIAQWLENNK